MSEKFIFDERKVGDITILGVPFKIRLGEGDVALKRKIDELVSKGQRKILLHLTVNGWQMDNGGLGEIVRSFTTLKRARGDLKILTTSENTMDLLFLTKLISVFEVFEDETEALSSFEQG